MKFFVSKAGYTRAYEYIALLTTFMTTWGIGFRKT